MSQHAPRHDAQHNIGDQVEFLELEAEVLAEHINSAIAWLPLTEPPREIVDLGCGTGAGTFALLARFPEARVTAVDSSTEHLHRLREKAGAEGAAGQVRILQADLDAAEWPDLGTPDLVWASAALHHLADPDRALRNIHHTLAPGGLLAVVELAGFPRFLPTGAPADRPGLEERCHAANEIHLADHVPHRGADWGAKLADAGFTVEGERAITVNASGSHSDAVGRYAVKSLQFLRNSVAGALADEDLAALDRLLDIDGPHSILHRDDLAVRTERTMWAARRS